MNDDDDRKGIERTKTPMPRARKAKVTSHEDDFDENGIIDRDEDLYNDNDDVSTSTLHGSEESLAEYIKEENKVNQEKSNGHLMNGKMRKLRNSMEKVVSNIKDKGKGFSCKNADNVIGDGEPTNQEMFGSGKDHGKSCSIM